MAALDVVYGSFEQGIRCGLKLPGVPLGGALIFIQGRRGEKSKVMAVAMAKFIDFLLWSY
jgi:hypothetical protein